MYLPSEATNIGSGINCMPPEEEHDPGQLPAAAGQFAPRAIAAGAAVAAYKHIMEDDRDFESDGEEQPRGGGYSGAASRVSFGPAPVVHNNGGISPKGVVRTKTGYDDNGLSFGNDTPGIAFNEDGNANRNQGTVLLSQLNNNIFEFWR